jgi:ribosomal protein S24E
VQEGRLTLCVRCADPGRGPPRRRPGLQGRPPQAGRQGAYAPRILIIGALAVVFATAVRAQMFKGADSKEVNPDLVVLFGFKVAYGGGRSTGFGLIYDSLDAMKKNEPTHRLVRAGLGEKRSRTRKAYKEFKRKRRVTFGTGRRIAARKAKRAAAA